MNLKEQMKKELNLTDDVFSHYATDLYVLYSKEIYNWLKQHYEFFNNIEIHTGDVNGNSWYGKLFIEIPFALER
jgi:hypothetical protein